MTLEDEKHYDKKDPTARTLETLHREIENLRELLSRELESDRNLETEKHKAIAREFETMEKHRVEQKSDTKQAVEAALVAQKEAVRENTIASDKAIAKSEASMNEKITQLEKSFESSKATLDTRIDDLKERIIVIESMKLGAGEQKRDIRENINSVYLIITIVSAMVGGAGIFKVFGG